MVIRISEEIIKQDIESGKRVIKLELNSISDLLNRIDKSFSEAIEIIFNCKGRTIVTGVGKSGLIARKIVATMNSTGTPAIFLHPSDAVHGDLGMVRKEDVVICISKSGTTNELLQLIPLIKRINVPVISMVGNINSQMAKLSDVVLDITVKEEACSLDLAPTSSTTVTLAMGDALAITLLEKRNFTKEDFAKFHPGGDLGKRLSLSINELMVVAPHLPIIKRNALIKDVILEMTTKRLGATCVINDDETLCGIVTDGDLRRMLQKQNHLDNLTAEQIMTKNPKVLMQNVLAITALEEMETYNITQMVIINDDKKPVGIIHLHDLVKTGLSTDSGV
ncbi:MAG: KpsF/GutQ family sugar-phosphate isomerase [Bacteroidetes bacterium]|nr:KpsF/GutQ family sugar-phosphate isomerase [Bacteroidota bacterium]